MKLPDPEILALHRAITAIPSVSKSEAELAGFLAGWLGKRGVAAERIGDSLLATWGEGPVLLLDTHLDTVPPAPGWSREPWSPTVDNGRVYGLGANDAKASVAAMIAAFLAFREAELPFTLALALVEGEETSGKGTEAVLAEIARRGWTLASAVIGEPTGLDLAIAQKGLLLLELVAAGEACHAAHAAALGKKNAVRGLARDLVALDGIDFGPPHPLLGAITLEPTQLGTGGSARNVIPAEATALLDLRTTPALAKEEIVARVERAVESQVRVVSSRLEPKESDVESRLIQAARSVRPEARLYGSATLSDLVFLRGVPAVKCGPGESARSHTADEFVLESEILDGARFYTRLIGAWAELTEGGER